ncbi:T9SS type A sorting domain-containing protein [Flavobacterium sp.]|uniref:T9SS type A sorting domain-containing protein n=1 Tax=Flavobacterium sp. TaxID=239 RepID=UPI003750B409
MSQTINTTYKTSINAKLAGLDKTKVPHNLLINQAMEFAELTDYNGAITTTNWATRGKFTSIYNTLLMSRVNASVTGLVSPTIFKTNWDNLRAENKIVLSGLYYKYSKFKPDAYPNFLVNNNGVVTDKYVGGVWQNPYIDQQVFAVSAPILVYKSLSLQVSLPALLWYTNQANSIQSIAIDFGNGAGYQTMTFGQDRIINYSASGTFEWKYKLTLTNAQILYSHSKLKIDIPVLLSPPTGDKPNLAATAAIINPPAPSCSNIAIVPFTGTRQYLGSANSATLQIDYAQNDCIIRNPLIVVEGFDSGLLGIENPFGEVSYIQFRNSTLESLNLYFEVINRDIIYINYNNGRDDLKRNAYLVEDIVKWVNTKKAQAGSTTPNIVIGQSMGGVIARYALRDMEVLGQAHQTSLFVSHDAPQQGANIPLGVQYFARHLADQFIDTPVGDFQISVAQGSSISIEDIQGLLNAQGTKQLLSNYINSGFAKDNSVFDAFQAELRGMGYPNQTRNIALSNGNHCAVPQDLQPSSTIFSLNGGASTTALGTILTTYLQPLTNIAFGYLAYEFNEPGLLLGLLPGSSNFAMSFNANALPTAGTNAQIYNGGISYTKVLFDFFGWRPQITVSLTDRSYNNPVQLSYDYYPGGKYQLPFNFESTSVNNAFLNAGITAYLAPSFNFIPVPSGLDIGSGTTPLNNADYLRKYNSATPPTGNTASPFANFTTSFPNTANINENHISFNTRNGNWLATELDNSTTNNQVFDCSFICADTQILGSNTLCNTATYTVPNNTNIYNWSITQGANLVTLSSNGSNTATLTLITGASGQVTLSLTFGDDFARCGNRTITKTIWVGGPSFSFQYNYFEQQPVKSDLCVVSDIPNYTLQQQGVTNIVFKNFNTNAVLQNSERICRRTSNPYCIEATVTNACGSTTQVYDCIDKLIQNNNFYTIYPNPSNNIISINLKDQNQKPISNTKIIATLYNMMGEKKSHVEIANNIASINVSNLPKGIYVLKINIDGNIESHQVAVE